jgi:thiol-disulfide isomerase/thioredoxin
MSRINSGTIALFVAAIIAAALLVLYVIRASPVHETIPGALSALTADPAPKPIPATSFLDAHNRPESLAQFKGRVVILNMWAIWCAPCVRELPALERLATALGQGQVTIVTVNASHDDAAKTAAFLKAHDAGDLPANRDPDLSLLTAFGSQGLPFSVVIDARGREIARASGPMQWDDPAAIAYFKSLGAHAAS